MKAQFCKKTIRKEILGIVMMLVLHVGFSASAWADDADVLFDENALQDIRLTVDPNDWQMFLDRYEENVWIPATFEWQGNVIENVGLRGRGFASRSSVKPGIKISFNHYVRGRHFLGLESIALKNVLLDPSMMRGRLALKVFGAQGFPTPRVVHARLFINETYRGLFELIESLDKPFLEARFAESEGNLYKVEAGQELLYYLEWRGASPAAYIPSIFKPETNQSDLDPSALVGMIDAVNNSSDEEFVQAVSRYLDWQEFLTYLAIENALAERDGFIGDWGINNFDLYQYHGSTRFAFIPWDYKTNLSNPAFSIFHNIDKSVLTRRALRIPVLRNVYLSRLAEAVDRWVNAEWLLPQIEFVYRQIYQAALDDSYKPYSDRQFQAAVDNLVSFAVARPGSVREQIRNTRSELP